MNKWVFRFIMCLCILGIGIQLYPIGKQYATRKVMQDEIKIFKQEREVLNTNELYEEMRAYNETIYAQKQSGLKDAFSYSQNPFIFDQTNDDRIGYLKIDKLQLEVPLYMGASYENLNKGVAVLAQTSAPIGGENTNCVIAGHRGGINGDQKFKYIEELENGDEIKITNPWQTLTYVVTDKIVIRPNDIEAVKIVPEQDMITLFSCHPYPYNTHRYVVYAQRKEQQHKVDYPQGIQYQSSTDDIKKEEIMQNLVLIISVLVTGILIVLRIKEKRS